MPIHTITSYDGTYASQVKKTFQRFKRGDYKDTLTVEGISVHESSAERHKQ